MWTELADAHLPASVPQFEEIRRLAIERMELFQARGMEALSEIVERKERIDRIADEMRQQFPLDANDSKILLSELRQRILRLREHEAECVRLLESASGLTVEPAPAEQFAQPEHELASR
jgi:hypothetical protein